MRRRRWCNARLLPGAARLLRHLRAAGVPVGMATSTPRATYNAKMVAHPAVAESFQTVHCGDEARPSPDAYPE
jgi:phosphoglycolate phosphatase-like HAD superfamily hydrolase